MTTSCTKTFILGWIIIVGMIGITIHSFVLFELGVVNNDMTTTTSQLLSSSSWKRTFKSGAGSSTHNTTISSNTRITGTKSTAKAVQVRPNNNQKKEGETWKKLNLTSFVHPPTVIVGSSQPQPLIPIMAPTLGHHRGDVDAVFTFATGGYSVAQFCTFIESLLETGYEGDIVLAVSKWNTLSKDIQIYLKHLILERNQHVIVYAVDWNCYKKGNHSQSIPNPTAESDCQMIGMYGKNKRTIIEEKIDDTPSNVEPVDDPRIPRPLATARFELYWLWSRYYISNTSSSITNNNHKSFILMMDFRDAYFQRDPFMDLDRSDKTERLYFYQEHGLIQESSFNTRWLRMAYGHNVVHDMKSNTIICSGSTIGTPLAVERYLRAIVKQFDNTLCRAKGCDQGFHNYIAHAYSFIVDDDDKDNDDTGSSKANNNVNVNNDKLHETRSIGKDDSNRFDLILVKQGYGVINNLGILRDKPLKEWGLYKQHTVYNWDLKTVSNVIHQFDRDSQLKLLMRQRTRQITNKYFHSIQKNNNNQQQQQQQ